MFSGSVDAYLPPEPFPKTNVTEDDAPTPSKFVMGPYAASKNKGDQLIIKADKTTLENGKHLRTCTLRIPYMYGEGDEVTRNLMEVPAKSKKYYPLGHDDHVIQKIYAGNAAWAHVLAIHKLQDTSSALSPAGKGMFVGDNTPLKSLSGHFQPYVDGLGAVDKFRIPFRLIYAMGSFIDTLSWLLQPIYSLRSSVTRSTIIFSRNSYTVSWDLASRSLGYKPVFTYEEGIRRNMVYLKAALNVP